MRRIARRLSQIGPEERLAQAVAGLPRSAQRALAEVADREDLPLVAGVWGEAGAGCLVANVVRTAGYDPAAEGDEQTLDIRVLELFPEMSSRDLNLLIVAWDEAALQEGRNDDLPLRRLLRGALARARVPMERDLGVADVEAARPGGPAEPPDADSELGHSRGADPRVTSTL